MGRNYSGRTDRRSRSRSHSSSSYGSRSGDDSSFKRHQDLFPVSVCFGRPDIERYITGTVEGTAITVEWADAEVDTATIEKPPPPSRLRRVCGGGSTLILFLGAGAINSLVFIQ